jgi:lysyl-tRNA synthetase class 2
MEREYTEQELVRREKVEKLKELGLDPFGQRFDRTSTSGIIKGL